MKLLPIFASAVLLMTACANQPDGSSSNLELNDLEYFESRGVNLLVYSNTFNGGFNDEKNSGISGDRMRAPLQAIPTMSSSVLPSRML